MNARTCTGLAAVMMLLPGAGVLAGTLDLAWTPCDAPGLAGYRVHLGASPGRYDRVVETQATRLLLRDLADDARVYFRVEAVSKDDARETLSLSAEMSALPAPVVTRVEAPMPAGDGLWRTTLAGRNLDPRAVVRFRDPSIAVRTVSAGMAGSLLVDFALRPLPGAVGLPALDAGSVLVVNPAPRRPAYYETEALRADVDGDGRLGAEDLARIEAAQGRSFQAGGPANPADLSGDGLVDGTDLAYCTRALAAQAAAVP